MKYSLLVGCFMVSVLAACSHDLLMERAQQGDVGAQLELAHASREPAEAFSWYEKAALQGHPDAQNNLGVLYQKGEGVKQDVQLAYQWFIKAAEQGSATAMYNIGNLYQRGLGVSQDYTQAISWYKQAAEAGISKAQLQLGEMYYEGDGVEKNLKQAYTWSALAASSGNIRAEKLRNKAASLLNVEDLVAAQQQASELDKMLKGKAL